MSKVGLTYWIANKLYLSVTNQCNANTLVHLRGPNFKLPQCIPLVVEPTPYDLVNAVDEAFDQNKIHVSVVIHSIRYYPIGSYSAQNFQCD
jgi:hypothetical protein